MTNVGNAHVLPDGVRLASSHYGGGYLYREGELLVAQDDVERVRQALTQDGVRLASDWKPIEGTDVGILTVAEDALEDAGMAVPLLIQRLASVGDHDDPAQESLQLDDDHHPRVSPNHVLCGAPHPKVVPAAPPRPAGPLCELPQGDHLPGAGVRVAVLDSGVSDKQSWFDGRVEFRQADVEDVTLDDQGRLRHYAGHGTFIAGVVLQHAPGAQVVARKVLDEHGFVDDASLAQALLALPDVDVVNLSLGGYSHGDQPLPATAAALETLLSRSSPPVVVASAGNDGLDRAFWPAAFKRVVSVAALDHHGRQPASFTNRGWGWVDACARGVDVYSAFLEFTGEVAPLPPDHDHEGAGTASQPGPRQFDGWALWSGTSFAAPRVCGAIASLVGSGVDASEAAFRLVGAPGVERRPGLGSVVDPPSYGWAHPQSHS